MKLNFWIYIMASKSGTLYAGMTNNSEKRVFQHKHKEIEGFSTTHDCNRLVYFESFDDVRSAINREKALKGWTRRKKIALIESVNPRWDDLSASWGREFLMLNESIAEHDKKRALARKLGAPSKG